MRSLAILLLIFCVAKTSIAQSFSYPVITSEGDSIADFIPNGWAIIGSATGDLNGDREEDVAMVIQYRDSVCFVNEFDTTKAQPRILVIAFRQGVAWLLAAQNNAFILMHDDPNMDEPFEAISINGRVLEVDFHLWYSMGSWYINSTQYKFRFCNKEFELIGAENSSFDRSAHEYENVSYNFLTGKYKVTIGSEVSGKARSKWYQLPEGKLKTLKELEKPYEWNVVGSHYL